MDKSDILAEKLHEWMRVSMRYSMHGFVRHSKENGLSMPQMAALMRIYRDKRCGVTEVGEHLGVTSAAASQMLDRLVREGIIDRSEDPDDRRGKRLALTGAGLKIIKEGFESRQEWLLKLAAQFEGDEARSVARALDLLVERSKGLAPTCIHEGKNR